MNKTNTNKANRNIDRKVEKYLNLSNKLKDKFNKMDKG